MVVILLDSPNQIRFYLVIYLVLRQLVQRKLVEWVKFAVLIMFVKGFLVVVFGFVLIGG